ncbi:MAG: hypothetical protein KDA24_17075 [Deltaproteobacteria bacterium]|nr:hypothetical protein [Deltaproteobacteria bacterium]
MNRTMTAALTAALLAIPLTAAGAGDGSMPPQTGHCQGAPKGKMQKKIDQFGPMLGTSETRKAWKKLVDLGEAGCDVILTFLEGDAAGMESADFADLGKDMITGGSEKHITVAADFILSNDEKIIRGVVAGLERRLIPLTPAQADVIAKHEDEAVRVDALGALIGYHREGTIQITYGVPHFKETAFWGRTVPPPEHHVAAVATIVGYDIPDHSEKVAQYVSRLYLEGNAGQEVWGDLLVEIASNADEEHFDSAAIAARGLGYGEPPAIDAGIDAVLGHDHERVVQFLVEGLSERLKQGRGSKTTLTRLEKIKTGTQHAKWSKAAEKLMKKYAKKV